MNAHPNINAPQPGGDMGDKTKKAIFIILALLLLLLLLFFLNTQDSGGGEFVELTGDGKNKTGQSNEPQQPEGKGEGEAGGEAEQEAPKEGGSVPNEFTINIGKPKPATPTPAPKTKATKPSTTPGTQKTASPGKGGGGEIERRLARAGAKTGQVQISLAWDSYDDLDLHVLDPNNEKIWYSHKRSRSGGVLDVDMNVHASSLRPVENIFWANGRAPRGKFRVKVVCFTYRGRNRAPVRFRVRMKIDGRVLPIRTGWVNPGGTVYVQDFTR